MSPISRIEVRNVTRTFGGHVALRGVTLDLEPGAITFIQGPNGAGKSTLLAIVGTLLRPSAGLVRYPPLGTDRRRVRRQLGWVAHESRCYGELSGQENVELAARLYGVDPKPAWQRICARVEAGAFAAQPVRTLSRGQRQRIAVARALVHEPSVLLLDEPLTGLDRSSVEKLEGILREERDRGTIVVVVSHVAGLAQRLEGRRIHLNGGRIERIED